MAKREEVDVETSAAQEHGGWDRELWVRYALYGLAALVFIHEMSFWVLIFYLAKQGELISLFKIVRVVSPLLMALSAGALFMKTRQRLWIVVLGAFLLVALGNAFVFPFTQRTPAYWSIMRSAVLILFGVSVILRREDSFTGVSWALGAVVGAIALMDIAVSLIGHIYYSDSVPVPVTMRRWMGFLSSFSLGATPVYAGLVAFYLYGATSPLGSEKVKVEKAVFRQTLCGAVGGILLVLAVGGVRQTLLYSLIGVHPQMDVSAKYALYFMAVLILVGSLLLGVGYIAHLRLKGRVVSMVAAAAVFLQSAMVLAVVLWGAGSGIQKMNALVAATSAIAGGLSFYTMREVSGRELAWGVALSLFVLGAFSLMTALDLKVFQPEVKTIDEAYKWMRQVINVGTSITVFAFLCVGFHHLHLLEDSEIKAD